MFCLFEVEQKTLFLKVKTLFFFSGIKSSSCLLSKELDFPVLLTHVIPAGFPASCVCEARLSLANCLCTFEVMFVAVPRP